MANDYFEHTNRLAPGTKARAEAVNSIMDQVESGLELLPSQNENNRGTRNYAGTSTGSSNAYAVTLAHVTGSYAAGQDVFFIANHANTGAATLNVSAIGNTAMVQNGDVAMASGMIQVNDLVHAKYNSALSKWQLMGAVNISNSVSAFVATLLDDANAAAFLATLGITASTAELNILDGVTASTAELNYNDITTLGTVEPSKTVTADANRNISNIGNLTATSAANNTGYFTYTGNEPYGNALYCQAQSTTGGTRGVVGHNLSSSGTGVLGHASATTGSTYGVHGQADSGTGTAGYFVKITDGGGAVIYAEAPDVQSVNPLAKFVRGTKGIGAYSRLPAGSWNPIVQAEDVAIIGHGTTDTASMVIAPHATSATGIRIDPTVGKVFINQKDATPRRVLIESKSLSNVATAEFVTGIDSTYHVHEFQFISVHPVTDGAVFRMVVSTDGGATWKDSGFPYLQDTSLIPYVSLSYGVDSASVVGCCGEIRMYEASVSTIRPTIEGLVVSYAANGAQTNVYTIAAVCSSYAGNTVNAVKFYFSSGNISSGTIKLYGVT